MRLLLVTPPMVQVNTPYPATAFLAGFLIPRGYDVVQADAGLELALRLFSANGIRLVAEEIERRFSRRKRIPHSVWHFRRHADLYRRTIDDTLRFLQGGKPSLARRILSRRFLPEGPRFAATNERERLAREQFPQTGTRPDRDRAIHLASLYLDDIADAIREGLDPRFELSRYGETLAVHSPRFDPIAEALAATPTLVDRLIDAIADELSAAHAPDVLGLTIPFPGNVYAAFRIARRFKTARPGVTVVMGGGYVSTELRELSDPVVFDHVDYVVLDEGEVPLLRILERLEGRRPATGLLRTFHRRNGRVVYESGGGTPGSPKRRAHGPPAAAPPAPVAPVFGDLPLDRYFSMVEMPNPMHRLWSCGRWNKLMLARGCYWHRCGFCDTALDYINGYRPTPPDTLVEHILSAIRQTGQTGFHFIDEAMPPALLRRLAELLLARKIRISWWGNIRFDKAFTPELAALLRRAGCVAVTGGLEAATDRLLALLDKGFGIRQAALVADAFARAGILVHAYLMYGCPTQTAQDSVDSLEFVRQLFSAGSLQSAYWHRFALTVHSPIYRRPSDFGLRLLPMPRATFARNEAPYRDRVRCDHARLGQGLRSAVYNYMHGVGLSADVREWFGIEVPAPGLPPDFVPRVLKRGIDTTA